MRETLSVTGMCTPSGNFFFPILFLFSLFFTDVLLFFASSCLSRRYFLEGDQIQGGVCAVCRRSMRKQSVKEDGEEEESSGRKRDEKLPRHFSV